MARPFEFWASEYAAHNVGIFPVNVGGGDKRPLIKGFMKVTPRTSRKLAERFGGHDSFGFAPRRAGLAVLDVDTQDERVLADALDRHGASPVIVRTASKKWHAYYKHNDEPRRIRPWPGREIDLIGDGFVMAAGSKGPSGGYYEFVQGSLDDLASLPVMHGLDGLKVAPDMASGIVGARITKGERNKSLLRHCLREAWSCVEFADLLERATAYAATALEPHPADPITPGEVHRTAESAWSMTVEGENWSGVGRRVSLSHAEVDRFASKPDALALLLKLKRHHWGRADFVLARAMAESLGWDGRRFLRARTLLEAEGEIVCVRRGGRGKGDPARFAWARPLKSKGYKNVLQ